MQFVRVEFEDFCSIVCFQTKLFKGRLVIDLEKVLGDFSSGHRRESVIVVRALDSISKTNVVGATSKTGD